MTADDTLAEPPVLPGLVLIAGSVPLVSPTPKPDLSDDLWVALQMMQAHPPRDRDAIERLIAKAEAYMGTTDLHRIDARLAAGLITEAEAEAERVAIRRRVSAEKRRRLLDEHQRAARLSEPLRDPVTVAALAELTSDAKMKRAEAESLRLIGPKAYRSQIHKAEAEARKLEAKADEIRRAELEQDRLYGEAKEPILMAKARGEVVIAGDVEIAEVARDEHGARIIQRRGPNKGMPALVYTRATRAKKLDGIQHAYRRRYLSLHGQSVAARLLSVGLAYQGAVGAANPLKAVDPGATGGGGCEPGSPLVKANEAAEWLRIARKELSPRQRAVLDKVCGEGFTVGDAARDMRAGVPATIRALRGGLAQAAESHRVARAIAARNDEDAYIVGRQIKFGMKAVAGVR